MKMTSCVVFFDQYQFLCAPVVQHLVVTRQRRIRFVAGNESLVGSAARHAIAVSPVRMPPPARPRPRRGGLPSSRRPTHDDVGLSSSTVFDTLFHVAADVDEIWKALDVGRPFRGDLQCVERETEQKDNIANVQRFDAKTSPTNRG